jgi:hypothetical protein
MIEQFFTQPKLLSRLREGVFGQNLPAFAASLHKEGYSRGCIRRHLRAADETQWLEREYWYSHSTEKIPIDGHQSTLVQWMPSTESQIKEAAPEQKTRKSRITQDMVLAKMSLTEWVTREQFVEWAGNKPFELGIKRASKMLTDMVDRDLVEVERTKRPKTNDLELFRRKE